ALRGGAIPRPGRIPEDPAASRATRCVRGPGASRPAPERPGRPAVRRRRILRPERPAPDGQPGPQASVRRREVRTLDDLRGAGPGPADPGAGPQDARPAPGDVPRPGARLPGQPDDDREAGLPPHPAGLDPRRPDREPDPRAAVPGVARDPPRLEE